MLSRDEILGVLPERLEAPEPDWELEHGLTDAAVLAPLVERDGELSLIFTLRHAGMRHHAGEVSFPGGRREEGETPQDCALREFEEELGVAADSVDVLGSLPPRTSIAQYRVRPLVGLLAPGDGGALPSFVPEQGEVDEVLFATLRELADRGRWGLRDVQSQRGKRFSVPFFDLGGHMLWGLTARFTLDLVERLRETPR